MRKRSAISATMGVEWGLVFFRGRLFGLFALSRLSRTVRLLSTRTTPNGRPCWMQRKITPAQASAKWKTMLGLAAGFGASAACRAVNGFSSRAGQSNKAHATVADQHNDESRIESGNAAVIEDEGYLQDLHGQLTLYEESGRMSWASPSHPSLGHSQPIGDHDGARHKQLMRRFRPVRRQRIEIRKREAICINPGKTAAFAVLECNSVSLSIADSNFA